MIGFRRAQRIIDESQSAATRLTLRDLQSTIRALEDQAKGADCRADFAMAEYAAAGVNPLPGLEPLQVECLWEGIALAARNEASEYRAVAAKIAAVIGP